MLAIFSWGQWKGSWEIGEVLPRPTTTTWNTLHRMAVKNVKLRFRLRREQECRAPLKRQDTRIVSIDGRSRCVGPSCGTSQELYSPSSSKAPGATLQPLFFYHNPCAESAESS